MKGRKHSKTAFIHRQVGSHPVIPVLSIVPRLGGSHCAECEKPIFLTMQGWRHANEIKAVDFDGAA